MRREPRGKRAETANRAFRDGRAGTFRHLVQKKSTSLGGAAVIGGSRHAKCLQQRRPQCGGLLEP
jgi:hypothetical protein